MKRLSAYFLLLVGLLFTSCIPTKDLIYLQGEPNQSAQAVNPVVSKPYRLQVNDILNITIKAIDPQFVKLFQSTETGQVNKSEQSLYYDGFVVDDHGNIRMPILNEVNVLGYTLEEARQLIEKRLLEEYFTKDANLFVSVKLAGFRYTINGEVASPGTKTLFQEKVNLMEAIANAGDISIVGDRKAVTVIRQTPSGTEIKTVDLTQRDAMSSPYFYLQPNDYVYVKPLPQKTLGTGTTLVQSMTALISAASLITTVIVLMSR
ncbi:polysaccharide biosynthesis/export family protein [Flavobacterium sp. MAH-1]|uniref:Polysaccharide biosynthesis/export family protein n=1 Tax=Flavobacterium agri TaxID=2743471 RepID=A0A7Y8Y1K0_9FLAO|nr:polysaccharide biosynthesis/export family protein [Flavobacterium agri]NUY80862.1 polysaccharide biosynthesis/export family protein [Flavobacterium agri]NYA70886.1 polysaccharide biosynthesis/export family protein [Flavobacterium agri]